MQHNKPIILSEDQKEFKLAINALDSKQMIQAVKNKSIDVNALLFSANGGMQAAIHYVCNALTPRMANLEKKTDLVELEALKTLIELRANINVPDTTVLKDTPLLYAIDAGHAEAVKLLLKNGAKQSIDIADSYYGNTPLLIALKRNYPDLALNLISNKANVNLADKDGNTPLHYACLYRDTSLINILLELGAKITVTNQEGISPGDLYVFEFQNFHWLGSDRGQKCTLFQKVEEFFENLDLTNRPKLDITLGKKLMNDKPLMPSEKMLELGNKLHKNFFVNVFWMQFLHTTGLVAPLDDSLLFSFPHLEDQVTLWRSGDLKSESVEDQKRTEEKMRAEGKVFKEILEKETVKYHSAAYYNAPLKRLHGAAHHHEAGHDQSESEKYRPKKP